LLTTPNQLWSDQIIVRLKRGERPLIAVGAAHLFGAQSMVERLKAQGYRVKRVTSEENIP
jgi:uncharacterized protein